MSRVSLMQEVPGTKSTAILLARLQVKSPTWPVVEGQLESMSIPRSLAESTLISPLSGQFKIGQ